VDSLGLPGKTVKEIIVLTRYTSIIAHARKSQGPRSGRDQCASDLGIMGHMGSVLLELRQFKDQEMSDYT
jgi:hypothetical protein